MDKISILKRYSKIILLMGMFMFVFVSCGASKQERSVDKFLKNFKERKLQDSYNYIIDDELKTKFVNYMDRITNFDNGDENIKKLSNVILDKIYDFTYDIVNVEQVSDTSYNVDVKLNHFDLLDAYDSALNEFLSKSLDFEHLDGLYSSEYIGNLLTKHINKAQKIDENVNFQVNNDGGKWKIKMDENLLETLIGNSLKVFDNVKDNIIGG